MGARFAASVSGEPSSGWQAVKDGRSFALQVVVNHDAGTVDYLREVAPGREGGARIRAVPRPGGGSWLASTRRRQPRPSPANSPRSYRWPRLPPTRLTDAIGVRA